MLNGLVASLNIKRLSKVLYGKWEDIYSGTTNNFRKPVWTKYQRFERSFFISCQYQLFVFECCMYSFYEVFLLWVQMLKISKISKILKFQKHFIVQVWKFKETSKNSKIFKIPKTWKFYKFSLICKYWNFPNFWKKSVVNPKKFKILIF